MSLNNGSKVTNSWNSHVYKENMISFENWLAGDAANNSNVLRKDPSSYTNFSINGSEQWGNITFGKLLKKEAMENALAQRYAASIASSACGIPTPCFPAQDEGSQFTTSSGNVSLQNQHTLLLANFDAEVRVSNAVTDRSTIPSRHFLDLNPPPKAITDADSRKTTRCQFEPITSEKTNRRGQTEAAAKNSSIDEDHTGEKSEIIRNGGMQLRNEKEKPPLVKDQLCEVTAPQLQENHKPAKGGTEEANLLKTFQQKTRRRKHMPEAITECKKRKTPKLSEQKTSVPQDTMRVNGKYVQKSGVNSPLNGEKELSVENFSTKDESETAQNPQNPLPPMNKDPVKQNHMVTDQTVSTRGKCQLVFSDVTHDKESNTCQMSIDPDGHWKQSITKETISSGTCLKRQNMDKAVEGAAPCNRNESGLLYDSLEAYLSVFTQNADNGTPGLQFPTIYKKKRLEKASSTVTSNMQILRDESGLLYDSLEAYLSVFTQNADNGTPGLQFPAIYKKKRSEKASSTVTSNMQILRDSSRNMFASPTNQGSYGAQSHVTILQTKKHANVGAQNGKQVFEDLLALGTATLEEFEEGNIREVNCLKPSQNLSKDDIIAPGNFGGQSTGTSFDPVTVEIIANRSVCLNEDGKDTEDTLSSQNSADSPIARTTGKSDSCLLSTSEEEPTAGVKPDWLTSSTSFVKLLQRTDTVLYSLKPSQNVSKEEIIPPGNFRAQSTDTSFDPVTSCEIIANRSVCSNEDGKDTEQTTGKSDSCLLSTSEEEPTAGVKPDWLTSSASFVKLLQMTDTVLYSLKPSQNLSKEEIIPPGNFRAQSTDTSFDSVTSCEIIANRSVCSNEDGKDTEQTIGKSNSFLSSTSEEELTAGVKVKPNWLTSSTSIAKLLQMTNNVLHGVYGEGSNRRKPDQRRYVPSESITCSLPNES